MEAAPTAPVLVRLMVGAIFLSEGVQKFLFAEALGAGRFARIGIPAPELLGPAVGGVEIACGALILAGYFTRAAAVPLIGVMLAALITTKLPILLGHDLGPFVVGVSEHDHRSNRTGPLRGRNQWVGSESEFSGVQPVQSPDGFVLFVLCNGVEQTPRRNEPGVCQQPTAEIEHSGLSRGRRDS